MSGYDPAVPVAGVPESNPPVVSESPDGNVPVVKVGAGEPVPVTLNVVPAVATVKVVVAALVIVGAELMFSAKLGVTVVVAAVVKQLAPGTAVSTPDTPAKLIL